MLSEQRKLDRLNHITGSDAGVIVGVNKYKNRVDLYLEKIGAKEQEDISDKSYVMAGNFLEPAIADWFTHVTGWETITEPEMLIHPKYSWMAGNIDRRILGRPGEILEIKTSSQPKDWGEEWTAEIPEQYLMQVAHYCAVTDSHTCYIAVLFHGIDFRIYKYERNERLERNLIEAERKFWEEHILKEVPPEPLTAKEVISLRATVNTGGMAIATDEIDSLYWQYMNLDRESDRIAERMKEIKDRLCTYIGSNEILLDGAGNPLVTWKLSVSTNFNKAKFKKDYPNVYPIYEEKGNPKRTFLTKQKLC